MNRFRTSLRSAALPLCATLGLLASASTGWAQGSSSSSGSQAITPQATAGTDSSGPAVVLDAGVFSASGEDDLLGVLKRFDPSFAGNNNRGDETDVNGAGESYAAIRNLGTLVLFDGHRIADSGFSAHTGAGAVDLSGLGLAMMDHVDVTKGGSSASVGPDAAGGVLNIVPKLELNSVELFGGYGAAGGSSTIDRNYGLIAGAAGTDGSITVGVDSYSNGPLLSTQRAVSSLSASQVVALGGAPAGNQSGSFSGTYQGRVDQIVSGGTDYSYLNVVSPLAAGAQYYQPNGVVPKWPTPPGISQSLAALASPNNHFSTLPVYLNVSNNIVPGTTLTPPLPAGVPLFSQSDNSADILNTGLYGTDSLVPTNRTQAMVNADFKAFNDTLDLKTEFLYSRNVTGGNSLAPTPITNLGGNGVYIPANNPYNAFALAFGAPSPELGADGALVSSESGSPVASLRMDDVGNRSETNATQDYTIIEDAKEKVSDVLSWDVSVDYSRSIWNAEVFGVINKANLNALLQPGVSGPNYTGVSLYQAPGSGAFLPVFDPFAPAGPNDPNSPLTIQALSTPIHEELGSGLADIRVAGSGTLLEDSAGKVTFDAGYEYLNQSESYSVDSIVTQGNTLGFPSLSIPNDGSTSSNGLFADIDIPLVAPTPGSPDAERLDLTVSGRADKPTSGGTSVAPGVGLTWQPAGPDVVFHANFSESYSQATTYAVNGAEEAPTFTIAQGMDTAAGTLGPQVVPGIAGGPKATGQFLTGWNGNRFVPGGATLLPESDPTAALTETVTAGVVYTPQAIKGLTLSLDYYHIREDHMQEVDWTGVFANLNQYGSASPYAGGFTFANGTQLTNTNPNQLTSTNVGSIVMTPTATGWVYTDGLDLGANYTLPAPPDLGRFDLGLDATVLFDFWASTSTSTPGYQYARQYTGGAMAPDPQGNLPTFILKPYADWQYAGWTTRLDFTYLPSVTDSGTLFGGPTSPEYTGTNTETVNGGTYKVPSYFTTDLAVSYDLGTGFGSNPIVRSLVRDLTFTVGVDDAFNKLPPYVPSAPEDNTDAINYSLTGRFLYAAVTKKF